MPHERNPLLAVENNSEREADQSMDEPAWLKIVVDLSTVAAAAAAWWSAKAARDAAVEAREISFDSFLPVLIVEYAGSDGAGLKIRLANAGRGNIFNIESKNPELPFNCPRIDVGEQNRIVQYTSGQ